MKSAYRIIGLCVSGVLLSACVAPPPPPLPRAYYTPPPDPDWTQDLPASIREAPDGDLQLGKTSWDISLYKGAPVRWGGTIVSVINDKNVTRIEIDGRRLDQYGRPLQAVRPDGRFVAMAPAPFDATNYNKGREVTVAGRLQGAGSSSRTLPIVAAEETHLWPQTNAAHPRYADYSTIVNYRPYRPAGYGYYFPRINFGFSYGSGYRHGGDRYGFHIGIAP